jgi:hypothetical protein
MLKPQGFTHHNRFSPKAPQGVFGFDMTFPRVIRLSTCTDGARSMVNESSEKPFHISHFNSFSDGSNHPKGTCLQVYLITQATSFQFFSKEKSRHCRLDVAGLDCFSLCDLLHVQCLHLLVGVNDLNVRLTLPTDELHRKRNPVLGVQEIPEHLRDPIDIALERQQIRHAAE